MGFAQIQSAQTNLLSADTIDIEADVSRGIHAFSLVGLADKAVEEARDRISSAIKYSGYPSPKHSNQKVVISLAPAHIPKTGAHFDLAISIAYLVASGDISYTKRDAMFFGEVSLDGTLRPIRGTLPLVAHAQKMGVKKVFLPQENCAEAGLVQDIEIYGAHTLKEIAEYLDEKILDKDRLVLYERKALAKSSINSPTVDMGDIKGQDIAKRALLIAAAGGHNIALWGPPGTGKTMLARAFCGIMPDLPFDEALEVTAIYSVTGMLKEPLIHAPPFRSPHHTASYTALVGGGSTPRPGEITLAHRGVLFLDELLEFSSEVLETLREPLEERVITISRARGSGSFPADFVLIAAMNPCPCGNHGVKNKECSCSPLTIERYKKKLSGPIIDRISMWVEVSSIEYEKLLEKKTEASKSSPIMRNQVEISRALQYERSKQHLAQKVLNGRVKDIPYWFTLSKETTETLNISARKLSLSGRSYRNIIAVARTIADLEQSEKIEVGHLLEALQYRAERMY